jgi:hypothetical protein
MTRYLVVVGVAVALVGLAAAVHANTMNILTNSGCDASLDAWTKGGGVAGGFSTGDGRPHSLYNRDTGFSSNVTSHTIAVGETFSLAWDAANADDRSGHSPSQVAGLVYQDGANLSTLVDKTITTGAYHDWQTYDNLSFTAVAGQPYIGKQIGVKFTAVGTASSDYVGTDNVYLKLSQVPEPLPEPSTVIMLCVSLISLLAYAWRKRR